MSIWEAFGKGRYKGFSREAGLLLDEAVELAGGLGCKKADTGHLLLAMLQTDSGPAGRFLPARGCLVFGFVLFFVLVLVQVFVLVVIVFHIILIGMGETLEFI